MKIAIDISPLSSGHKVRGVGFYLEYLKRSLLTYCPENEYKFFTDEQELDKSVDIVHYPYFDPFFLTLPVFKKYKRVVTVHDLTPILYPQHFPAGIKGKVRWEIQKQSLKWSDMLITDSYTSQRDIARILKIKKKRVNVVYLAAGEEYQSIKDKVYPSGHRSSIKHIREKYNLPEKFVLYVGDLTWNKNIPALIEAIKKINLTLVLVGKAISQTDVDPANKWNKDLLKAQKMIKNDKRFIRLGFVPTEDLVALYNAATVFVFPSIYEGFGLPVIEAMQSGCPVVLSKEGCLKEVGGEAAYYVNPYNANSIANGIGEVYYSTKLQKELSQKGIEQAKRFSWKKTAEETVKVYRKVIGDSG